MKHTKIFLALYVLSFTTTHCMKRPADISESSLVQLSAAKPKTIHELQKRRDNFIALRINDSLITPVDLVLFQEHWVTDEVIKNFIKHPLLIGKSEFSYLTLATMAVKSHKDIQPVPFAEKKKYLQKCLKYGFRATEKDKEFAFLEKWERCAPLIIKKICYIHRYIDCSLEKEIPQELKDYIATLTFWEKFNTEESLL